MTFAATSQADKEKLLSAFAIGIADGSLVVTVKNYVRAASEFATDDNFPDPHFWYDHNGNKIGGQHEYFPALKELYNILSKWKVAKAEGLPLTIDKLKALANSAEYSNPHSEEQLFLDYTQAPGVVNTVRVQIHKLKTHLQVGQ